MIQYRAIRSAIVRNLSDHLGLEIIPINDGGDLPKTSFMTYDVSDISEITPPVTYQEGSQERQIRGVSFSVSFLSYADDRVTSIENALRARDWFHTLGYQILKDLNVIVFSSTPVENRDIQIGVEWERRQGFEVELRAKSIATIPTEWIDTVNLQRSE